MNRNNPDFRFPVSPVPVPRSPFIRSAPASLSATLAVRQLPDRSTHSLHSASAIANFFPVVGSRIGCNSAFKIEPGIQEDDQVRPAVHFPVPGFPFPSFRNPRSEIRNSPLSARSREPKAR